MASRSKKISYFPRRTSQFFLRNKADKALQQCLTELHPKCELCGKPVSCVHHFFPKSSASALRYQENNLIPVCVGCHLGFHSSRSAEFIGKTIAKRGNAWFQDLCNKKREIIKPTKKYYLEVIEFYGN